MILFVHIPKCGGKSFRVGLENAYGDALMLHYNNPLKKSPWLSSLPPFFRHYAKFLGKEQRPANKAVIYGHYCFDDFPRFLNRSDTVCAAFFRDPVEWVGSYLFYNAQKNPDAQQADSIIETIRKKQLDKSYSLFLGTKKVEALDFVGIVEEYDKSLGLFQKITGKKIEVPHINRTKNAPPDYRKYFKDKGVLEEVKALMAQNDRIYQKARERFATLGKEYSA